MIIDRDKFRAWLEARDAAFIGSPYWSCRCPIAAYLSDANGMAVNVTTEMVTLAGRKYPLPKWASRYIEKIDCATVNQRGTLWLQAEVAREILETIR